MCRGQGSLHAAIVVAASRVYCCPSCFYLFMIVHLELGHGQALRGHDAKDLRLWRALLQVAQGLIGQRPLEVINVLGLSKQFGGPLSPRACMPSALAAGSIDRSLPPNKQTSSEAYKTTELLMGCS